MREFIVGIDVGGTFTDVVAADLTSRRVFTTKVPSQPQRPARALLHGILKVVGAAGVGPEEVQRIVHGTTIATNAILERKGATVGVLTTQGFEDILAIGRMKRSEIYDLNMDPEEPLFLAPRRRIRGIPERVDSRGSVVLPLDEKAVVEAVQQLREQHAVKAVAVCYLFSFLNPAHEQRTAALIRERFPDLAVSLSSEVDPKFREYERLVVTAFDCYIRPVISDYVADLQQELASNGLSAPLQIMQSNGGITGAATVARRPVTTILSGPAAGVVAGAASGRAAGFENMVTVDIGGTSCDVALVRKGAAETSLEGMIDRYPLRIPMVDVHTIGSGGGSIAWIDRGGGLKVGPQSAGASPGPACYGRGGEEATVTDASIVLGYLNPDNFVGGEIKLDPDLAALAVERRVAEPLGLSVARAAAGIHEILNTQMAEAVRLVSVRRGYDLRNICLVAEGGAGPVHIGRMAQLLGAQAAVVPLQPGVSSAYGLLLAEIRHEHSRPYGCRFEEADPAEVARLYTEIDQQCTHGMADDGVDSGVSVQRTAEMRYVGQSYELQVPLPAGPVSQESLGALLEGFHAIHRRIYGHASPRSPVEIISLRGVHRYQLPEPPPLEPPSMGTVEAARIGTRQAYFTELVEYVATPLYDRHRLPVGTSLTGPAILEQYDTTTVVYPGQRCVVHESGNLVISAQGGGNVRES